MNELEALMGLQVLDHLDCIIARRRKVDALYRARLRHVPGIHVPPHTASNVDYNHAYFPVEIDAPVFGMCRNDVYDALKGYNVFARRYFHPLIPDMACYRDLNVESPLTVARQVADRVLSLPIYDSLALDDVEKICDILKALGRS